MKIDDDWNLVVPVIDSVSVFHTPLSQAAFEANFRLISATKADLFGRGNQYAFLSGLNVAALTLKDLGRRQAAERGEEGDAGAQALLDELARTSTVLVPGRAGLDILPVPAALSSGAVEVADWEDVENQLVFFTCAVYLTPRRARRTAAQALVEILGASLTSSNCEAYARGSTTSAPAGAPTQSSVPT